MLGKMNDGSFWHANLDKLLLLFVVLIFVGVGYHASHHMEDINSGYSQFVQQNAGLALGALLTLLTVGGKKGSSAPPPSDPPVPPPAQPSAVEAPKP